MELVPAGNGDLRTSGLTMHVNKVHHVTTINSVAEDFAVDEDWLAEVASEMDIEGTPPAWAAGKWLANRSA